MVLELGSDSWLKRNHSVTYETKNVEIITNGRPQKRKNQLSRTMTCELMKRMSIRLRLWPIVKCHWWFLQPSYSAAEINLWYQFPICEWKKGMRRDNSEIIDLLNNLWSGESTTHQLESLWERLRISSNRIVCRRSCTIKQAEANNETMTAESAKTHRVYLIRTVDEFRQLATHGQILPNNRDVNNSGGQLRTVKRALQTRIMISQNISVTDGLVNGVIQIIKKL